MRFVVNNNDKIYQRAHKILLCMTIITSMLAVSGCNNDPRSTTGTGNSGDVPQVKHMVDTHIHLYDPKRPEGLDGWPPVDDKVLYQTYLPDRYKKDAIPARVTAVVIVEASTRLSDNRWILDLVAGDDVFIGLVGNLDLTSADFSKQLMELKKDKRLVGLRARNKNPIDFSNEQVLKNLRELATSGLALDMLTNGQDVAGVNQVDAVARAVPNLRIVANHMIGYNVDGKAVSSDWEKAVQTLAENKNVWVKISGLYQRSTIQPAPHVTNYYSPVLEALWKNFGINRLVYGSNWPCTEKSGDYASFVRVVHGFFRDKGQAACERYYWANANEVYRLGLQ